MRLLCSVLLVAAVSIVTTSAAKADNLSGNLTADNGFYVYLSTSATSQGTLLAQQNNWPITTSIGSVALTPATTYYLQIAAFNQGGPGAMIGSFSLSGTSFEFENGLQALDTNTTDWTFSFATSNTANYPGPDVASGWGLSPLTPVSYGVNGVSPWGTRSGIDANAQWLWESNGSFGNSSQPQLLFETTITPLASPVPEPGSFLLLGSGLLAATGMLRQR